MPSSLLTPQEFDTHVANRTLRLAFVGMSNAGKSYRAKILENDNDFFWYQVDDDIQKALGFKDQKGISSWLGYPTSEGYKEREQRYLEFEDEFTGNAALASPGRNLVFDTTGSVIYSKPETLANLRENTLVVHLDVGEDSLAQLVERFFKEPKPLAWHGHFTRQPGESEEAALRRSYPTLLKERCAQYRELAHLHIKAEEFYNASGEKTLSIIRGAL